MNLVDVSCTIIDETYLFLGSSCRKSIYIDIFHPAGAPISAHQLQLGRLEVVLLHLHLPSPCCWTNLDSQITQAPGRFVKNADRYSMNLVDVSYAIIDG